VFAKHIVGRFTNQSAVGISLRVSSRELLRVSTITKAMASNPLLALLNSAGQQPQPARTDDVQPHQKNGPTSPFASAPGANANSLLQSLLSPTRNATSPSASIPTSPTPLSPSNGIGNTAADLLSLLGGSKGAKTGATYGDASPSQQSNRTISQPSRSPMPSQLSPSPQVKAQALPQARARVSSIFDSHSPFDILSQPHVEEAKLPTRSEPKHGDASAGPRSDDITKVVESKIEASDWHEEENIANDRNVRAFRHLAGLRASSTFDDEQTSGLKSKIVEGVEVVTLDLDAAQPGGKSSLYPAKLEITAISLLKSVQKYNVLRTGPANQLHARWTTDTVLAAENGLICYVTGKSKVRLLDENTGERAVIGLNAPVRSIFLNLGASADRSALRVGVLTDKAISVWKLHNNFGQQEDGAEKVFEHRILTDASFVHATFAVSDANMILAVHNDGSATLLTKTLSDSFDEAERWPSMVRPATALSFAQADRNGLVTRIYGTGNANRPIGISLNDPSKEDLILPPPAAEEVVNLSFSAYIANSHTLLMGFNRNTVIAVVDTVKGNYKRVYRFEKRKEGQYNIVKWHARTATLFVFNSLRSSLFALHPLADAAGSSQTLREFALPEVWLSFDVEQADEDSLRIAAFYSGGVQSVRLPLDAVQAPPDLLSAAETTQSIEIPVTAHTPVGDESAQSTRDLTTYIGMESLDERLAEAEHRILSTLKDMHLGGPNGVQEVQRSAATPNEAALLSKVHEQIRNDLSQSVSQVVARVLPEELRNALMRPDLVAHLQQSIVSSIITPVQKTAMDVVTRVLAPHFEDVVTGMTRKMEATVEQHMTNVRKDIVTEQSKALLESEAAVRDLTRQVGQLTSMMESLSRQNGKLERALNEIREEQKVLSLNSVRPISATAVKQQEPSTPVRAAPTINAEDMLLASLSDPNIERDVSRLQHTLKQLEMAFGNAHRGIRNEQGSLRVSQAVNLALLHRLIKALSLMPLEEAIPWIEACSSACERNDVQIARVFEGVRQEMVRGLIEAHQHAVKLNRAPWWTGDRLYEGSLRFLR
jgi:hypothetical protein